VHVGPEVNERFGDFDVRRDLLLKWVRRTMVYTRAAAQPPRQ
jgi:hypothetical protein